MGNNQQSRKWALVINNPLEAGLDHSALVNILQKFSPAYWCMADEVAATGTYYPHFPLCSIACPFFHPQKSFSNRALGESIWKCQGEQGIHPKRRPMGGDRQGGNLCGGDV